MARGGEIITMVAEVATNRVAPALSNSDMALRHCKRYNLLTNSMAYGTRRFNAAFTRALQYPYPKLNEVGPDSEISGSLKNPKPEKIGL